MKKWRGLLRYRVKIMERRSRCRSQMRKFRHCKEQEEVTVVTTTRECQVYHTVFKDRLEGQVLERSLPSCTPKTCWVKERDKAIMVCQSTLLQTISLLPMGITTCASTVSLVEQWITQCQPQIKNWFKKIKQPLGPKKNHATSWAKKKSHNL